MIRVLKYITFHHDNTMLKEHVRSKTVCFGVQHRARELILQNIVTKYADRLGTGWINLFRIF